MRYFVTFPTGEEVPVEVSHLPTGEISVVVNGRTLAADALPLAGSTSIGIDHHIVDLWMEGAPPNVGVIAHGHRFYAKVESERMRALSAALGGKGGGAGDGLLVSPMPGRVLKILVAEGDAVEAGTPLAVVEAMKMENELVSQRAGTVKKVHATPGQNVESGAKLVEVG
ncbi:Methylcrotonyl-CoA carboxylase biotin-containing subunit protein [Minicystis rosea]|nr:Methylcrotonyl-CoA carboxylase biotin-containing subunit protein [Minicystis rosea]